MDPTLTAILLSWKWRPDVMIVVLTAGAAYVVGWRRLRKVATATVPTWRLGLYLLGLLAIVVALQSPIDTLGSMLFVFHMPSTSCSRWRRRVAPARQSASRDAVGIAA